MSVESAVRAMLADTVGVVYVPDARVTHGYRLQDSILPAITFELAPVENTTLGSGFYSVELTARAIAETTIEAIDIGEGQIRAAIRTGSWDGVSFSAAIYLGMVVEPPNVGEGDESEPAEAVVTATLHFSR